MMTEQTAAKYEVRQHVHVTSDLGDSSDRPGTVSSVYVPDDNRDSETLYAVTFNDGDSFVFAEHELSSCDLAEALSAELQRIRAEQQSELGELGDDHGPGCDGPLNCTCDDSFGDAECERKSAELSAVRSTIADVIYTLQQAAQDLAAWEIDDYADMDMIASSAVLEQCGDAAATLLAVVAVMSDSHPVDAQLSLDQASPIVEQLRSGSAHSYSDVLSA